MKSPLAACLIYTTLARRHTSIQVVWCNLLTRAAKPIHLSSKKLRPPIFKCINKRFSSIWWVFSRFLKSFKFIFHNSKTTQLPTGHERWRALKLSSSGSDAPICTQAKRQSFGTQRIGPGTPKKNGSTKRTARQPSQWCLWEGWSLFQWPQKNKQNQLNQVYKISSASVLFGFTWVYSCGTCTLLPW